MAQFQTLVGTLAAIQPSRSFSDGVYCRRIEFSDPAGARVSMERVFFPLKLTTILKSATTGEFYFWNSHCYAFRSANGLIEDIDGVRASYFWRDARLLLLMSASIVLLPYVLFVIAKKLIRGSSRQRMQRFLSAQRS